MKEQSPSESKRHEKMKMGAWAVIGKNEQMLLQDLHVGFGVERVIQQLVPTWSARLAQQRISLMEGMKIETKGTHVSTT